MLNLKSLDKAFTQGGNRLCFFHPEDSGRCIKIARPDRTPELRRKQKSFPKNLKPLDRFDENKNEFSEIKRIQKNIGDKAFSLIPRCYGFVDTDLGQGLCLEMIKDDDGKVSLSLKQYLWLNGVDESLQAALKFFARDWQMLAMPSRDLLLHNIVVQQALVQGKLKAKRLVVIDGLGWSGLPFIYYLFNGWAKNKARKKIEKLEKAIKNLMLKKDSNADWGYHGWLNEEQRVSKEHV